MKVTLEQSIKNMLDNHHQLQVKKGPYYDKWLRNYHRAVEPICQQEKSRYALGMKAFLDQTKKH